MRSLVLLVFPLASGIGAMGILSLENGTNSETTKLLCFIGAFSFNTLILFYQSKKSYKDLLNPTFSFFIPLILYYGISVFDLYAHEIPINTAIYWTLYIAYFGFLIGFMLHRFFEPKMNRRITSILSQKKSQKAILVFLLIMTFGFILIARSGLPILSNNISATKAALVDNVSGYATYANSIGIDLIIIIFVFRISQKKHLFSQLIDYSLIILCVLFLIATGSRAAILFPMLVVFLFKLRFSKLKWNFKIKFKSILRRLTILSLFLVLIGTVRDSQIIETTKKGVSVLTYRFAGELNLPAEAVSRIQRNFPQNIEYLGTKVLIWPFKSILPGKDEVLPIYLQRELNLKFQGAGYTPSIIGGFYVIQGSITVFIGMIFSGLILYFLYKKSNKLRDPWSILLFSYFLVYFLNSLKGGVLKDFSGVFHIIILYVYFRYASTKTKSTI